ncbi:MAG: beta-ketoacyl synthase N-terminal-like domain-containing protein, partial [Gemmatimonadales bacterium]
MTDRRRRIAITGIGIVSPLGNDTATTWEALLANRTGVAPITIFDASGFPVQIAAEVKGFDPYTAIEDRKILKFANRCHNFAIAAAEEAIRDAGIRPENDTKTRWGCVVGSGMMGVEFADLVEAHQRFAVDGHFDDERFGTTEITAVDPVAFCRSQVNTGLSLLLRRFGIRGYATAVHTACASGGQAVGAAMKLVRHGTADFVIAG